MKVLVTTEPGLSHANATIPFAIVLKKAGWDLLVAASPSVVENFKRAGLDGRSIVPEPLSSEDPALLAEIPALGTVAPQERIEISRREVSVRRRAIPLAQALLSLIDEWAPDLILRDATELAGWAVAERYGILHASIEVGLHWAPAEWYGPDGSALAGLRAAIGLPREYSPPASLYRYLHFGTSPPGFLPAAVRLPTSTCLVRPTFYDNYGDAFPLPCADEWAYLAFSTVYKSDENIICALAADLAHSFQHVLVSGTFPPPAANVTVSRYMPQSLAMSHCSVVVCHGGRNTVLTALSAGVPTVCVPIASDQFVISSRVASLGIGRACSWGVREIGAAAVQVARQPWYRKNAMRLAAVIMEMPPVEIIKSAISSAFKQKHEMSQNEC